MLFTIFWLIVYGAIAVVFAMSTLILFLESRGRSELHSLAFGVGSVTTVLAAANWIRSMVQLVEPSSAFTSFLFWIVFIAIVGGAGAAWAFQRPTTAPPPRVRAADEAYGSGKM